jgi:hypothetical protein
VCGLSSANFDTSIPGLAGMSATYTLKSNGRRREPWGIPARIVFHSEKCPCVLALDLLWLRYANRSSMESFGPAVCNFFLYYYLLAIRYLQSLSQCAGLCTMRNK